MPAGVNLNGKKEEPYTRLQQTADIPPGTHSRRKRPLSFYLRDSAVARLAPSVPNRLGFSRATSVSGPHPVLRMP